MFDLTDLTLPKLEFELDLNGFAIIRGALQLDIVERMNTSIEAARLDQCHPKFHFIEKDDAFFKLISHPPVLTLCARWISPTFRFDHAWGVHHPPYSSENITRDSLHAGPHQNQGFFHYSWYDNHPKVSCIVFGYALKDQPADNGGLVLLPGSHKLNYPLRTHASREIFERFYDRKFSAMHTLARPSLKAGDLLIMAEATVHGTAQWTSQTDWRRNIYYKYCHGFMGWIPHDNQVIKRLRAKATTEVERRLLEPPYVARDSGNAHDWRLPVEVGDSSSRES